MPDKQPPAFTWCELIPPPLNIAEYYLAIGRHRDSTTEDYQLHVFRFPDQEDEDWHLAIHIPLASPGYLAEYCKQYCGPLEEAKSEIEGVYRIIAGI